MKEKISNEKRKHKTIFGKSYSPYISDDKTDMNSWYEEYKKDPKKTIILDGKTYHKVINRCEYYLEEEYSSIVIVDLRGTKLNDELIDENGNIFIVQAFETLSSREIPKWYSHIIPMVITGKTYDIGAYLARK